MAIIFSRYIRYFSILILIFSILYKYEISSGKKTLLLTKQATLQYNRSHVYKIITDINKYPLWYPNIIDIQHIGLLNKFREGNKYGLITHLPLIGNITSILTIQKLDSSKRFIYSVNSWLLEINSIELKNNIKNVNITYIEWNVYTKRSSLLFQYILFPFAKFYKNQLVREALFSLILQIRHF